MKNRGIKKFKQVLLTIIDILPLLVPISLAITGGISVVFLLLGSFSLAPIVLLSATFSSIASVYLFRITHHKEPTSRESAAERHLVGVVALIFVLLWVGFNIRYNAQHVYTNRDPAIYAVAGAWLSENSNVDIPRLPELTSIQGVKDTSAGFGVNTRNNNEIYAQGTHILPAFLGLFGRIVGKLRIYPLNILFGGAALLSLYAFARLIMKSRWALVAMMTMAASLPMLYFSRDTYTEPLALAFTFGGLALTIEAYRNKMRAYWFLGGLVSGAGALTRIDAYMALAFMLPFIIIYLAGAPLKERRIRLLHITLFLVGVIATALPGYLDVKYLSSGYYRDTWALVRQELVLIGAFFVTGVLTVGLTWKTSIFANLDKVTKPWRATFCAILLMVAFVGIFVRPLFYDQYQRQNIVNQDGSSSFERVRGYKEEAPYWVLWYVGPVATFLGMLGICIMLYRAVEADDKDSLVFILFVSVVVGTALIYFVKPSIAADQIWASRRMLPVIIPGFIVAAAFLLQELYKGNWSFGLPFNLSINYPIISTILATTMVLSPLMISIPFIDKASFTQLSGVIGTCKAAPKDSTILWVGLAKHEAPITTRAFCDIPSVGYYPKKGLPDAAASREALSQFAKIVTSQKRVPILGRFDDDPLVNTPDEQGSTIVADGSFSNVEYVKGQLPRTNTESKRFIRLSIIKEDGSLVPMKL